MRLLFLFKEIAMKHFIVLASALLAFSVHAQTGAHDHAQHSPAQHSMAKELVPAEIRALDLKNSKITLRHGELKNLGMPPMTMVFALDKKLALPADLKVGDKVQVRVEDLSGALTVTRLTR